MADSTQAANDDHTWASADLRAIAATLLTLADAFDSKGIADPLRPGRAAAEREQLLLMSWAQVEFKARQKRSDFLSRDFFGEPAWDIMLDLFIQHGRGKRVSIASSCQASGVAETTTLRWLAILQHEGMLNRIHTVPDERVQFIELTEAGLQAVSKWLRYRAALSQ